MILWSALIKKLVELGIEDIEKMNFSRIEKLIQKIFLKTSITKPVVVVIGRPNVGKSVLAEHLVSKSSKDLPASRRIERLLLTTSDGHKKISVIPGQECKVRAGALASEIQNNKRLNGIVYVVDWGHTDIRDRQVEKMMVANNINSIEKLLAHNKKEELEDFTEMISVIKKSILSNQRPKWLIIAVNKIDLYFDKIDDAQSYYHPNGNSEFSSILLGTLKEIGLLNLTIKVLPITSGPKDLKFNENEIKNYIPDWGLINKLKYHFLSEMSKLIKDT